MASGAPGASAPLGARESAPSSSSSSPAGSANERSGSTLGSVLGYFAAGGILGAAALNLKYPSRDPPSPGAGHPSPRGGEAGPGRPGGSVSQLSAAREGQRRQLDSTLTTHSLAVIPCSSRDGDPSVRRRIINMPFGGDVWEFGGAPPRRPQPKAVISE